MGGGGEGGVDGGGREGGRYREREVQRQVGGMQGERERESPSVCSKVYPSIFHASCPNPWSDSSTRVQWKGRVHYNASQPLILVPNLF